MIPTEALREKPVEVVSCLPQILFGLVLNRSGTSTVTGQPLRSCTNGLVNSRIRADGREDIYSA